MALFLGAYYSNVTFMNVILRLLNPTNLYITSGAWFMENDITLSFAGNEFWIIGVTGVLDDFCVLNWQEILSCMTEMYRVFIKT